MGADRKNVVVIGAGLAGLAAAGRLSRAGCRVVVLDRAQRPGGRAAAERVEGFGLEAIPPVLSTGDRHLLRWVDTVGMRDDFLPLRPLVRFFASLGTVREVEIRRWSDVRRVPGVGLRGALRLVRLPRLLRRYGDALDPDRPERAADLDDRSLADFCRLYFGDDVLQHWMAPVATSGSLGDSFEMSRVQLLHQLRRGGLGHSGLPRASLSEVAERAAAALQTQLGVVVDEVEQVEGERPLVRLLDGRILRADAVIVAVPAAEALRLCDNLLVSADRDALAGTRYAPSLTVAAALCRPLASRPQQILLARDEASPIESVTLEPGLRATRVPEGRGLALIRVRADFAASHFDAPDDAIVKEILGALEAVRPGVERATEFTRVLRIRDAAPRFDVGRYRALARFGRVQSDRRAAGRRVYFAGDHLVNPSFEGAIVSAERAADAARDDLFAETPAAT